MTPRPPPPARRNTSPGPEPQSRSYLDDNRPPRRRTSPTRLPFSIGPVELPSTDRWMDPSGAGRTGKDSPPAPGNDSGWGRHPSRPTEEVNDGNDPRRGGQHERLPGRTAALPGRHQPLVRAGGGRA